MKKIYNAPALFLSLLFLLMIPFSCQQTNENYGLWKGTFMDHYRIEIEFNKNKNQGLSGMLRLYDGDQMIQNDKLTKIKTNVDQFSFYIEAKQTTFIGVIEGDVISGNFIFPDRSKHKLLVTRMPIENISGDAGLLTKNYPADQLQADLDFVAENLESLHPNLFSYQDQKHFDEQIKRSTFQLKSEQDIVSFYTIIAPLTSSIGCSHTGVRLPKEVSDELEKSGNYFPAKLFFKDDKVFFVDSYLSDLPLEPGDEVTSINNIYIGDIVNQIFTFIPSEGKNVSGKYYEINNYFDEYYVLIDNNQSFLITFRKTSGGVGSVLLESCNYEKSKKLYPKKNMHLEEPFPIEFDLNTKEETAHLSIPTFGVRDIEYYNWFMDSVFTLLDESAVQDLVIDLRGNSGGHPIFAGQLFSYLANEPFVYFDSTTSHVEEFAPLYNYLSPSPVNYSGRTFVWVDGGCLSTTGHLISLLKYHQLALIIGQEPGSSYTCNDKSVQFTLPNTGIGLNIPTIVFQTAVDNYIMDTSMLDVELDPTLTDVLNNTDPFREKTNRLILQNRSELVSQ